MDSARGHRLVAAVVAAPGPSPVARVREATCRVCGVDDADVVLVSTASGVVAPAGLPHTLVRRQFELGEGPSVDAHARCDEVLVEDVASAQRWPVFAADARAAGVHALFALPLRTGPTCVGVLTLLHAAPRSLTPDELADARGLARLGLRLLVGGHALAGEEQLDALLPADEQHPWVVHQATGMLAAALDLPIAAAMLRLRAHAWATDTPLEQVAQAVTTRQLRLER